VRRARPVVDAVRWPSTRTPGRFYPRSRRARTCTRASANQRPTHFIDIAGQTRLKLAAAARETYDRMLLGRSKGGLHKLSMRCCAPGLTQTSSTRRSRSLSASTSPAFQRHRLETLVMSYWASALVPPLSRTERKNLAQHLDALQATVPPAQASSWNPRWLTRCAAAWPPCPSAVAHGGAAPGSGVPPNSAVAHAGPHPAAEFRPTVRSHTAGPRPAAQFHPTAQSRMAGPRPAARPPNNTVTHGGGVAPPRSRVVPGGADEPPKQRRPRPPLATPPPVRTSPITLSRQIAARLAVPCIQLVAGHFPFDRRAVRDASFQDFSRLFAPKGTFEEVFRNCLHPAWILRQIRGERSPRGQGPARRTWSVFARQHESAMYSSHAGVPSRFPIDIPAAGPRPGCRPLPTRNRRPDRPLRPRTHCATVVKMAGPTKGTPYRVDPGERHRSGRLHRPWALFRLFDHAAIQETGTPGHFRVVFDVGGRHASFEVESDTGANPFRLRELERFDCPISGR